MSQRSLEHIVGNIEFAYGMWETFEITTGAVIGLLKSLVRECRSVVEQASPSKPRATCAEATRVRFGVHVTRYVARSRRDGACQRRACALALLKRVRAAPCIGKALWRSWRAHLTVNRETVSSNLTDADTF
jgi:hypothetical protein